VNILHCLMPETILFGLPQEVGAGWRFASQVLRRLDAALGTLPGVVALASTRLVTAVKD
jgi:hypothetical protein